MAARYPKGKIILALFFLLAWLLLSFSLSAQPAGDSARLSRKIAQPVAVALQCVGWRQGVALQAATNEIERIVRKGAHWSLYFLLGCLLAYFAWTIGWWLPSRTQWLWLLAGCVAIACLDEWHQLFVPGRSAQVGDVGIDTLGSAMGLGSCWLLQRWLFKSR